jgi:hypothetical protein
MDKNRSFRLLSKEENDKTSKRHDLIHVTIDFGQYLDKSKKLTHKEFSDFLFSMYDKYKTTIIEEFIFSIARIHAAKAEKSPLEKIEPELTYRLSGCGGCGCATADPEPPGHVVDSGCFCCP